MRYVRSFLVLGVTLALLSPTIAIAQPVEIKFLVSSSKVADVEAIKAKFKLEDDKAKKMDIYFFETADLSLLGKGLALRLRGKHKKSKVEWESTVKERPASEAHEKNPGDGKVEKDQTVKQKGTVSYSLDADVETAVADAVTHREPKKVFSEKQHEVIGGRVDWTKVWVFPVIAAKRWELKDTNGIEAEQWDYAGHRVLEFSMKGKDGAPVEKEFEAFLSTHGFKAEESGKFKTEAALKVLKETLK